MLGPHLQEAAVVELVPAAVSASRLLEEGLECRHLLRETPPLAGLLRETRTDLCAHTHTPGLHLPLEGADLQPDASLVFQQLLKTTADEVFETRNLQRASGQKQTSGVPQMLRVFESTDGVLNTGHGLS